MKLVHFAPALFTLGSILLVMLGIFISPWFLAGPALHIILLFLFASIQNRSVSIGLLAILSSYTQLLGYGTGFIKAFWRRLILGRDEFSAFNRNFYK